MGRRQSNLTVQEKELLLSIVLEDPYAKTLLIHKRYDAIAERLRQRSIALSTVRKWIKVWKDKKLIPSAKAPFSKEVDIPPLEKPWSFGLLSNPEYEITQNAVDALMKAQRYSLQVRLQGLTIREALWIARLARGFVETNQNTDEYERIRELFNFALRYAARERICEVLPQLKLKDTSDIDMQWVLTKEEQILYEYLGIITNRAPINLSEEELKKRIQDKNIPFEKTMIDLCSATINLFINTYGDVLHKVMEQNTSAKYYQFVDYLFDKLPEDEDQDIIYATILIYLSKGPKWNTLSGREYLSLFWGIKECLKNCQQDIRKLIKSMPKVVPMKKLVPQDIISPELLVMVGYEVSTKKQEKPKHRKSNKKRKKK